MFSQLEDLLQFVDQTIATISTQYPAQVKCRPGCADCCHAVFDVSLIEAAYLATFLSQHTDIIATQEHHAATAAVAYEKIVREASDPSAARIRCPLLSAEDLCLAHPYRPINCRTYGTPTVINGKAHVCGYSGFTTKNSYSSIDLAPLQKSLSQYSAELGGDAFKERRFPIAWVLLRLDFFLPR